MTENNPNEIEPSAMLQCARPFRPAPGMDVANCTYEFG